MGAPDHPTHNHPHCMNLWQRTIIASSILLKGTSSTATQPKSRPGYAGKNGSAFRGFAGSDRDWKTEAGNMGDNSAVAILLNTVCNNFADAPLVVQRHTGEGNYEIVPDHAVSRLLKRPNDSWTRTQLFRGIVTSLQLDGNCYIYKARNGIGEIVELWWLPHTMVKPIFNDEGEIIGFEYKYGQSKTIYSPDDIIHMRLGVDDDQPGMGKSPLRSVLREICTDNEVLTYTYAILKNLGVPGVILSPKVVKGEDEDTVVEIPKTLPAKIKALWRTLTTGDNRGEPLVLDVPWDVTVPGFKPSEMMIDKVGELAETRIAGAFGVPVVVVQFLSGLRNVNAKASYEESIQQLYGCCLIPLQRLVCEWLDLQLLPELGDPETEHTTFDRSEIAALQEDVTAKHARADAGWNAGNLKRSEARAMKGFQSGPEDDVYIFEVQGMGAAVVPVAPIEPAPDPTDPDGAKALKEHIAAYWRGRGVAA
jgi:HK97 family phage portal protein